MCKTQSECYKKWFDCNDYSCPFYDRCKNKDFSIQTMQDLLLIQMKAENDLTPKGKQKIFLIAAANEFLKIEKEQSSEVK